MRTLEKDILLIVKGWYKEDHENIFEALKSYYMREYTYGKIDFEIDKRFLMHLFLEPTVIEFAQYDNSIVKRLFEHSFLENTLLDNCITEFYDVMYQRCINALQLVTIKDLDFLDYQKMLDNPDDENLRII